MAPTEEMHMAMVNRSIRTIKAVSVVFSAACAVDSTLIQVTYDIGARVSL